MSGPVGELPGSPPREVQAAPPQMAALNNNEVTITANEYYDLLHEIERLHAEIEELKVQDIVSRNPGINVEDVRRFRATGVMPATHSMSSTNFGRKPSRKPGDCVCECHKSGMTGALGPCAWCFDLHRPRVQHFDGSDG